MRIVLCLLVCFVGLLPVLSAQAPKMKDESWAQTLPPGDAKELVLNSCNSSCHNLKMVVTARKNHAGWAKSMNDMIQRGATVFPDEIEPITSYLTKFFGPGVPPQVNVNTASRESLEKTPGLSPEMVTRILEARSKSGPFKNPEELREILGTKREEFDRLFYLLKYSD